MYEENEWVMKYGLIGKHDILYAYGFDIIKYARSHKFYHDGLEIMDNVEKYDMFREPMIEVEGIMGMVWRNYDINR